MVRGVPARKGRDAEVETLELPLYGEQVEPDPALIELIAHLVVAQSRVELEPREGEVVQHTHRLPPPVKE